MKQTLLEIVQQLLSSMDSDEVQSISDTTESYQIAVLLKQLYYDIAIDLGLSEHEGLFELNASIDPTKPTIMTVPNNVLRVDWIKYDTKKTTDTMSDYKMVNFMCLPDFLEMMENFRNNQEAVEYTFTNNNESFTSVYRNDKFPDWYTTVDDDLILFDSYVAAEDSTLVKAKTMCYGLTYPTFSLTDNFVPDLNPQHFSYYINRAKVRAFAELKQTANPEAAAEARRQKVVTQFRGKKIDQPTPALKRYKRYGRK